MFRHLIDIFNIETNVANAENIDAHISYFFFPRAFRRLFSNKIIVSIVKTPDNITGIINVLIISPLSCIHKYFAVNSSIMENYIIYRSYGQVYIA